MAPRGRKKSEESKDSDEKKQKPEVQAKSEPVTKKVEESKPIDKEVKKEERKDASETAKSELPKKLESKRSTVSKRRADSGPKIEFNLSDGVTWHDFAGLVLIFFKLIWWILKIILWPVFWVWAQNVKIKRFIFASDHDRVMTEDERYLFESVPTVFILTGLVGGILLGILIGFNIHFNLDLLVSNLNSDFIGSIGNLIGGFINFIYTDIFKGIVLPIFGFIGSIFNSIKSIYDQNPFAAFFMLVILGIIVVMIWITFQEKFGFKVAQLLRDTFGTIYETPFRVYDKILVGYRSFNHKLTQLLVGRERLETRTQMFFKRTLLFTSIVSLWTFVAGVYIGLAKQYTYYDNFSTKLIYTSFVLIVAGLISGILIFAFVTRYFDLMNRKKYISSEFIKEPRSSE